MPSALKPISATHRHWKGSSVRVPRPDVLESLARHVLDTDQCAFTWTGPYGGGKSSLAVALGSLLGELAEASRAGGRRSIVGNVATAQLLYKALPVHGAVVGAFSRSPGVATDAAHG